MSDALIIVNMEGHILTINDAAARLLGYRQEDLVDQPLARLLASERRSDLVAEFIHNSRVGVRIIDWEVELCDATGQVIPVSVCSACLSGATVNGEAVIMSARDMRANRLVSELSTTAEQLRREIATRQQAEAELRASEEKYRTLFETAGEGIVIIDQASTLCLFVNQAMAKLFGYEMEELLAKKITDLLPEEAREEFNRFFFGKDGNRESVQLFPCLRKDNSIIHARITNTSMILGEKTCLVGFFSDVTEQKLANQALEKAKNEAEAASRAKTEFLARISHELRTPMNGIIGLTGIMLNSELAADQHHYLELIKSSANNLLGMISDVLDFSNLETETLAVQNFDFKLRQVLAENMIRHEEKARAKGLGFAWQVENEVPDTLRGDFQRLLQIISKLVANGIMFTDDGEVTVTLSVREKSEGSVLLLCRVQDTGVGIAPDQQSLIFQPFTQVDGSFTRNYGGMGLGLALTAQLVKLMDGEIWLESPGPVSADGKEGQGSTFYFTARFAFLPEKADDHGFNLPA